ncbi:hypothetical protein [Paenibacillus alvei]|uniref:hypothetical protein n=1 Tax=Paenibacillus alvei TaxID=44250 RepID=UPI0013DC0BEB|nr:hypothetical protein [Paenibacillus alvei]NEZ41925.1 hypothetical protein [Paenibacillus alvei]
MKLFKKGAVFVFSIVLLFTSLGVASASEVQSTDVNGVQGIDLNQFFEENVVPKEKQELLKEKVRNNELWDAYKPELQQQIPADFFAFEPQLGNQDKYYRFPDGSFIYVGTEMGTTSKDPGMIQPFGSSTDQYGTTYWDFKCQKIVGTASAYVYADFFLAFEGNGYKSKIFKLYGANASGFGVTGTPSTEIIRPIEDLEKERSALARSYWFAKTDLNFSWEGNGINTSIGTTCSLWLGAIRGKLYVDSKLPY